MDANLTAQFQSEPREVRVVTNGQSFALQVDSNLSAPVWYAPWRTKKIDSWWVISEETNLNKNGLILSKYSPKLFATKEAAIEWLGNYNKQSLLDEKLNTWKVCENKSEKPVLAPN